MDVLGPPPSVRPLPHLTAIRTHARTHHLVSLTQPYQLGQRRLATGAERGRAVDAQVERVPDLKAALAELDMQIGLQALPSHRH